MSHDEWNEPDSDLQDEFDLEGEDRAPELDRVEVLLRALYSVIFAFAISLMNSLLFVLVAFQLVYSLITERLPSDRVQRFGHQISGYYTQILRYLTHNDWQRPFPFSDFPEAGEPPRPAYARMRRRDAEPAPRAQDAYDAGTMERGVA